MSERLAPWRSKPSEEVTILLAQLAEAHCCYLVHRSGPTSFVVRDQGADVKRRVSIGAHMTCTCDPIPVSGAPATGQQVRELCLHTLFVLVKVLRVPPSNPLVWQLSLTDRELDEALRCSILPQMQPKAQKSKRSGESADDLANGTGVKRRTVEEEEPCPICYDGMAGAALEMLVWCRQGCGHNVHGKCLGVWSDHQVRSLGKELTCPMCRTEWGEFKWKPPPQVRRKAREARTDVHLGTVCHACKKAPLTGKRYCCLVCADLDLCDTCFHAGNHLQHTFAERDGPTGPVAAAHRAAMMPTATGLSHSARGLLQPSRESLQPSGTLLQPCGASLQPLTHLPQPPVEVLHLPSDMQQPSLESRPPSGLRPMVSEEMLLPSESAQQPYEGLRQRQPFTTPLHDHRPASEFQRMSMRNPISAAGAAAALRQAAMLRDLALQTGPESESAREDDAAQAVSNGEQAEVGVWHPWSMSRNHDSSLVAAASAAAAASSTATHHISNTAFLEPVGSLGGGALGSEHGSASAIPNVELQSIGRVTGASSSTVASLIVTSVRAAGSAGPSRVVRAGSSSMNARAAECRRLVLTAPAYDDLMRVLEGRAIARGELQVEGHHAETAGDALPPHQPLATQQQQESGRTSRCASGHVLTLLRLRRKSLPSGTTRQPTQSSDATRADQLEMSVAGLACHDPALRQRNATHDSSQSNTSHDPTLQDQQQTDRPAHTSRHQSAGPKSKHSSPVPVPVRQDQPQAPSRKACMRPLPARHVAVDQLIRRESTGGLLQGLLMVNGQVQAAAPATTAAAATATDRACSSLRRGSSNSLPPLPDIAATAIHELCRLADTSASQPGDGLYADSLANSLGRSHAEELHSYDTDYALWNAKQDALHRVDLRHTQGAIQRSELGRDETSLLRQAGSFNCNFPAPSALPPSAAPHKGRSSSMRLPSSGLRVRPSERRSSESFEPQVPHEEETGWPTSMPALSLGIGQPGDVETRRDLALGIVVEKPERRDLAEDGSVTLAVRGKRSKNKSSQVRPQCSLSKVPDEVSAGGGPVFREVLGSTPATDPVPLHEPPLPVLSPDLELVWQKTFYNPVFSYPYSSQDVG